MNLRKINDEVFVATGPIVELGRTEIEFLKQQARTSKRKRARICAHKADDDPLHEMIIVLFASSYIPPHRHVGKSESFHIIDGQVDVVIFDDAGAVSDVIQLGDPSCGRNFYYRLNQSYFHTLLIRSEFLVLHEVTNGPFARDHTILAPFAPAENDLSEVLNYTKLLSTLVAKHIDRKTTIHHEE